MEKKSIVEEITKETGMRSLDVKTVVELTISKIRNSLEKGENVYLRGFGTFSLVERKAKTVRDISKNKTMIMPARKIVKFKPGEEFARNISSLKV